MRSVVTEPVAADLAATLRRAVLDHASGERRRVHPPVLHVGVPGGRQRRFEVLPSELDHATRVDVVLALLAWWRRPAEPGSGERRGDGPAPLLWLTRALVDDERAARIELPWLGAVDQAQGEAGTAAVPFVVVDRRGWHDPRDGGAARHWVRIRPGAADRG